MTETTVRVRVDTTQARSGERQLKQATGRAQRLRARAAKKLGLPTSRQAIGAAVGFRIISRFRRTSVVNADPWTVASASIDASAQLVANKILGTSLRANRAAREETAAAFGVVADAGQRQALSRDYYKISQKLKTQEETGRLIVQRDIVGPSLADLTAKAFVGYLTLLKEAGDWMLGEMEGK